MRITYNTRKVWKKQSRNAHMRNKIDFKKRRALTLQDIVHSFFTKPKPKPTRHIGGHERTQGSVASTTNAHVEYKIFKPNIDLRTAEEKPVTHQVLHRFGVWGLRFSMWTSGSTSSHEPGSKTQNSAKMGSHVSFLRSISHHINYHIIKYKIFERLNAILASTISATLILFVVYLCFFDTFFLIQNYRVEFAEGSYISEEDMHGVLSSVRRNKLLGFVPNNQFWFINDRSLTAAVRPDYPEVQSVHVLSRQWPNTAVLQVSTRPILVTIGIGGDEYWRISQDGEVMSKDEAGLRDYLVVVERPVSLNIPGASFRDYSFANDCNLEEDNGRGCVQLNRFWFIRWLWDELDRLGIPRIKTVVPSLFDTDVYIYTSATTRLMFDSGVMSRDIQRSRLNAVMTSTLRDQLNQGLIAYVDLRIPKRVYVCRVQADCSYST